ncbi:hypothetical protein SG06_10460 [Salmonella enterica]|uniref:Uncharacterized protein n=1 Tax=Salmonella gallinarum TaxID=594 RepID=A0A737F844_SALGL|nr:hypothetical protein [Salmonella enterica]EDU9233151.1 hypothetical protein [Salmonella enterica subsp. enterica]EDV1424708.1 hypothetical protein [Salmonella enterica subsp. enterica serovar Pullorum]HAE8135035.1 hypothetical protein [Salmonella enterica subsp. enterica serovar Gallinarum]EAY5897025.1 hypothetical protein [Salmonella enterica]
MSWRSLAWRHDDASAAASRQNIGALRAFPCGGSFYSEPDKVCRFFIIQIIQRVVSNFHFRNT